MTLTNFRYLRSQGCRDPFRSMANKGGDGGGVKYDNLEKLYGTQAQAAEFMLDQSMPNIEATIGNSKQMVGEAMDGSLAERARGQAGADASAAIGQALTGAAQHMERYGATINPNALDAQTNNAALTGAATKVDAVNKATQWAEDQKWNRNAGLYSQASGTGNGAMASIGSAGAGLAGIAGQQTQAAGANAAGYGQAGAMMAYGMMKAEGGEVNAPKLAEGGDAWASYKKANPVKMGGHGVRGVNPLVAMASGALPMLAGRGLKEYGPKAAKAVWEQFKQPAAATTAAEEVPVAGETLGEMANVGGDVGADVLPPQVDALYDPATVNDIAGEGGAQTMEEWLVANDAAGAGFADGGCAKRGPKFAGGGLFQAMPSVAAMDASSSMRMPSVAQLGDNPRKMPATGQQAVAAQSPLQAGDAIRGYRIGSEAAKSAEAADKAKEAGNAATAAESAGDAAKAGDVVGEGAKAADTAGAAAEAGESASAAADASEGANASGNAVPYGSVVKAGVDIMNGRDAGTAVADAAASYGGAQAGAYVGTAIMPGVGTVVGGVLGGLLGGSIFAEGGEADGRADYTPGGAVRGPGTGTSDDIPAWLSNGEIVENTEAVKLAGKEALLAINQVGRDVRHSGMSEAEGKAKIAEVMTKRGHELAAEVSSAGRGLRGKPGVHLAGGGLLGGNLGIAMGAGVQQINRQEMLDMQQQGIDMQKQAMEMQKGAYEQKQKEWAKSDALDKELGDIAQREAAGDVSEHIAKSEGEAKAAAANSGNEWAGPLTSEQRAVIARTPGLGKMTPSLRYELNMDRARAFDKQGNIQAAEGLRGKATQEAAGDFINAILSGNAGEVSRMYKVFPNNDNPKQITFDADGNMKMDYGDGKISTIGKRQAVMSALALHDPKTAATLFQNGELLNDKLDNWMKSREQANNLGFARLEAQLLAGGRGGRGASAGSKGGALDDEAIDIYDRKKFNDLYLHQDSDKAVHGDKAHSWAIQMYNAARDERGVVPLEAKAEIVRLAKEAATPGSKIQPTMDFVPESMGFRMAMKDEAGNTRWISRGLVRPDSLNTATGQSFFTDRQVLDKVTAGLADFSKRDADGYKQAQELAADPQKFANFEKQAAGNKSIAEVVNAARLIKMIPAQKPGVVDAPPGKTPVLNAPKMQPGRDFAERQASYVERANKANADADLVALQAQSRKLLRDGNAYEANAVLKQFNQLRKERYGL